MHQVSSAQIVLAILLAFVIASPARACCMVGNRFFPATLNVDDPCVTDELALPGITGFKNGDQPSAQELDISGDYEKTITENFGFSIAEDWIHLNIPRDGSHSGFDDLATGFKYQFVRDAKGELDMSVSLDVDWGETGSSTVGAAPFTTLTPTVFAGKGFGFLPEIMKFFKPFAVTAQVGYSIPTEFSTTVVDQHGGLVTTAPNPQFLVWGGSLQYSMPYLKSSVQDLNLPAFVNQLFPLVEAKLSTPVANFSLGESTTGTINPGIIYVTKKYQFGVEAILPINRASGDGVGVIGQFDLYLDDIFPKSVGRPLFAPQQPAGQ